MTRGFKNLGIGLLLMLATIVLSPLFLIAVSVSILGEFWRGNYFGEI